LCDEHLAALAQVPAFVCYGGPRTGECAALVQANLAPLWRHFADGADVVDRVIEIPMPGRTFCGPSTESASGAAPIIVPVFFAGPENHLLAGAIERLMPPLNAACDLQPRDATAALPAVLSIHGKSGTGKTHLARGLVRNWHEHYGAESAEYFTATDFRHELVDAIKRELVADFRRRVRGRRLLVVDDLDRLPDDAYLQEELRYTIDACREAGGLLVVTSSRPVGSLRNLAADVRGRLAAGLVVPALPPDAAARRKLALHASALLGRPLSAAAADRLTAAITGTANDIFGALFGLYADRSGQAAGDVAWVDRYLLARRARRPAMRVILQRVAKYYRVPQHVLKSSSRRQSAVFARAVAVYLAREIGGLSYEQIGRAVGGRDHTTVMHNYRKIARQLERDLATREAVDELRGLLGSP
jgi:chromosomal replication initiator protein